MSVLFYLGHPAHFHLFKHNIRHLKEKGLQVTVCIKSKDVLEDLLKDSGISYVNISETYNKRKTLRNFATRLWRISKLIRKTKPAILLGSAAELAVLGKLHGIPSFIFFEDDFEVVPQFAKIAGPLATGLVCPECCSAWKWERKKISHRSYHELAYLHPNHFVPDPNRTRNVFDPGRKNFILRFAELTAYHDTGKSGITTMVAQQLIDLLLPYGNVYITSERPLEAQFERFRIRISPADIHHALYFSDMYIGDSQTMTAEAAVLGTPAIRFNDFVGRLSYLEEMEHKYALTFGIKTNEPEKLFSAVRAVLEMPDAKALWALRRARMLEERVDLSSFIDTLVDKNLKVV
jgi:uncharacterized protein